MITPDLFIFQIQTIQCKCVRGRNIGLVSKCERRPAISSEKIKVYNFFSFDNHVISVFPVKSVCLAQKIDNKRRKTRQKSIIFYNITVRKTVDGS